MTMASKGTNKSQLPSTLAPIKGYSFQILLWQASPTRLCDMQTFLFTRPQFPPLTKGLYQPNTEGLGHIMFLDG